MHFVKIFTANFFLSLRSLNFCLRGCYNASLPNRAWSGQCQIYVRNFLEVFFYLLLYKRPFFVTSKINYDRYVIVWTKNIFLIFKRLTLYIFAFDSSGSWKGSMLRKLPRRSKPIGIQFFSFSWNLSHFYDFCNIVMFSNFSRPCFRD